MTLEYNYIIIVLLPSYRSEACCITSDRRPITPKANTSDRGPITPKANTSDRGPITRPI